MRAPSGSGTLILTRNDVATLLELDACIQGVEDAFRMHGSGRAPAPAVAGIHVERGGFHMKAGALSLGREYFAAKTNANFMDNRSLGLPTIQGTIGLFDATNGYPLAVMDSIEISIRRTGAATAVAAKYLARPTARVVAVAGCGEQGRAQLRCLTRVLPVEQCLVWDLDPDRAESLCQELAPELHVSMAVAADFPQACATADVIVTCTPSHEYLLTRSDVPNGAFVAGVGVDNPHKKELDPSILAEAKVVVDVLSQASTIGDLHHAFEAGAMTEQQVYAELGEIVDGRRPGRTNEQDVFVFDSTGMALQDVASAVIVFERALQARVGDWIDFAH